MCSYRNFFQAFIFCTAVTISQASSVYYTFEGTITDFRSYNDQLTLDDYDVQPGQTQVSYRFMVDFERDVQTLITMTFQRDCFHSELLEGGLLIAQMPPVSQGYNQTTLQTGAGQGWLIGGSGVYIWTSDAMTSSWKVGDWTVGQHLNLTDGGYFSAGEGGAVFFDGDVVLTSVTPEPATFLLLSVGALFFCRRIYL